MEEEDDDDGKEARRIETALRIERKYKANAESNNPDVCELFSHPHLYTYTISSQINPPILVPSNIASPGADLLASSWASQVGDSGGADCHFDWSKSSNLMLVGPSLINESAGCG